VNINSRIINATKKEIDTRFIPKFTPQRSYVSVEVLTKSRVAL